MAEARVPRSNIVHSGHGTPARYPLPGRALRLGPGLNLLRDGGMAMNDPEWRLRQVDLEEEVHYRRISPAEMLKRWIWGFGGLIVVLIVIGVIAAIV
jgi:hypothetical protein